MAKGNRGRGSCGGTRRRDGTGTDADGDSSIRASSILSYP